MSGLIRRRRDADEVDVEPGERVLTRARTPTGAPVVVTAQAIYVPTRSGDTHRIAWDDVAHAAWESPVLEVVQAGSSIPVRVILEEPGRVPEAVRERVTSSIVVSERVELEGVGGAGARIIGRRSESGGGLRWTITFDRGLDPDDPGLRAAADSELARIKAWYGP